MLQSERRDIFRFLDFELDVSAYELRRGRQPLKLERQPMDLLILLVERHHQLVSRSDIVEHLWGRNVFVDVETGINTAIRKIRNALGDAPDAPTCVETVPGKGYRFVAPVEMISPPHDRRSSDAAATWPAPAERTRNTRSSETDNGGRIRWWRWGAIGGGAIIVLVLAAAWLHWLPRTSSQTAMHMVPLTTMSGSEYGATFSPDGRYVAFGWDGEREDNWDIYIQLVGTSELRRLTTNASTDMTPSWSPDGRQIAYLRFEPPYQYQRARVISPLGGSDRQVSDFPVWWSVVWSPDGRYLVAGRATPRGAAKPHSDGLYLLPVNGGEPRAITTPQPPETHQAPAFSPDGRLLAYVACHKPMRADCSINVVAVDSALAAAGRPRRLASVGSIRWLTWTRDGKSVIYSDGIMTLSYLWRVAADGSRPPERIEVAGVNAAFPSIASTGDRLAFSRSLFDVDVYGFQPGQASRPIARSTVFDDNPQFSPDGRRIAFCSLRSGEAAEVWVANADGSEPQQLTHGPGRWQCAPAWSPDGGLIAFDSLAEDRSWHIWTVDLETGRLMQVTNDAGDQNRPTWSLDGEWIYFSWKQGDGRDIWRKALRAGTKERITTRTNAMVARESVDGASVLYTSRGPSSDLWAQPLAGGQPRRLIECVWQDSMIVSRTGIYYLPCVGNKPLDDDAHLRVMDAQTGKDREFGRLERFHYDSPYVAVSPDNRAVLYARTVGVGADLMILENFR